MAQSPKALSQPLPGHSCCLDFCLTPPQSSQKTSLFSGFPPRANTHSRCAHYRPVFMFRYTRLSPSYPAPLMRILQ